MISSNSFDTLNKLVVDEQTFHFYDITRLPNWDTVSRLPFCLKILLENFLRNEDGQQVTIEDINRLCHRQSENPGSDQISFTPARIILQDFTGVPAVVDLAAMRDAIIALNGDPASINPLVPVDLVIDHSVMVDYYGTDDALEKNTAKEFERNRERYQFLRWGQSALKNFRVVPPGTGIVHQVNLEFLADVVTTKEVEGNLFAFPDTLVGTDSHTTMINGLGVLGWGVGGIEAEAAMLGQPVSMALPEVIGFQLDGTLNPGVTATDLVLTITEILRKKGVVGKFVEFYGDGLENLTLANRATIANMAPEYGATCAIFPIDDETLHYLRITSRDEQKIKLIEAYAKAQHLWRTSGAEVADYNDTLTLSLDSVVASIAGPKRPQQRIALTDVKSEFNDYLLASHPAFDHASLSRLLDDGCPETSALDQVEGSADLIIDGQPCRLTHGDIVVAAITSCTNTSNPQVMLAAGLLAKKAVALGLKTKAWVKTSLAPGSQVVPVYLANAGLMAPLNTLGFHLVGFGCTTCIGNSGPLNPAVSKAIHKADLTVCSILSGNRNFEGRIHQEVRANFLASPPLVVAYALAGSMMVDLINDPLGHDDNGKAIYLKDIWPSSDEIDTLMRDSIQATLFSSSYKDVFEGTSQWHALDVPEGDAYQWPESTYVKKPPFFDDMTVDPAPHSKISQARCLVKVGDSITTDHISPAGAIGPETPAGQYLKAQGIKPENFNSLGSRRGNHEVMMRGTFANNRLRNHLVPNQEGGFTYYFPDQKIATIYYAAMAYQKRRVPLIVLAGKEYGSGSSRDWAAKGTRLLGVKAVIAESFERIHRANLVGFGVLPLEFKAGETCDSLGLSGKETFSFDVLTDQASQLSVTATDGEKTQTFDVNVRIDTPAEWDYYHHGGILHFVLRQLAAKSCVDQASTNDQAPEQKI